MMEKKWVFFFEEEKNRKPVGRKKKPLVKIYTRLPIPPPPRPFRIIRINVRSETRAGHTKTALFDKRRTAFIRLSSYYNTGVSGTRSKLRCCAAWRGTRSKLRCCVAWHGVVRGFLSSNTLYGVQYRGPYNSTHSIIIISRIYLCAAGVWSGSPRTSFFFVNFFLLFVVFFFFRCCPLYNMYPSSRTPRPATLSRCLWPSAASPDPGAILFTFSFLRRDNIAYGETLQRARQRRNLTTDPRTNVLPGQMKNPRWTFSDLVGESTSDRSSIAKNDAFSVRSCNTAVVPVWFGVVVLEIRL